MEGTERFNAAKIHSTEAFWRDYQPWLQSRGYMLRPRYRPGWKASWLATVDGKEVKIKRAIECEDSRMLMLSSTICDAKRISDGVDISLKSITPSVHPYEADIGNFLSSKDLASDPRNHCVPILEVLKVPDRDDMVLLVMPLLRMYDDPPFETLGEVIAFFGQMFEGLQFMHKHHVAHRDCMGLNMMMDGSMYPNGWHPCVPSRNPDYTGDARYFSRTQRPPKYYLIDFGLSRRYNPKDGPPLEYPILGGDKTVPEFQTSDEACDPFPTDVYYMGNMVWEDFIQKMRGFEFLQDLVLDMIQDNPSKRPTMDEVVRRFNVIRRGLNSWKLRSRIAPRDEHAIEAIFRSLGGLTRRVKYTLQGLPAIPSP